MKTTAKQLTENWTMLEHECSKTKRIIRRAIQKPIAKVIGKERKYLKEILRNERTE
jgi:hypothetical protein